MKFRISVCNTIEEDHTYKQNIFRISPSEDEIIFRILLKIPYRLPEDTKQISQKQLSTISGFYYNSDITPRNCGWQQASALLNLRLLSFAVAETLEDGFLADNRILIAPLISAYISQKPYLCAVARAWSLGNYWPKDQIFSQSKQEI